MKNLDGLNCGAVLAALYNAAGPSVRAEYEAVPMTAEAGRDLLEARTSYDNLMGRTLHVSLSPGATAVDLSRYDAANVKGAGEAAIESVRACGGDPINSVTRDLHDEAIARSLLGKAHGLGTATAVQAPIPEPEPELTEEDLEALATLDPEEGI